MTNLSGREREESRGVKLLFKRVGELLAQGNVVLLSGSFKGPLRFMMVGLK